MAGPGQRIMEGGFDRQAAEFQVPVAVLNGRTATGNPVKKAAGQACPQKGNEFWRRRRDSNPRDGSPSAPLAGVCLRPLGHISACASSREAGGKTRRKSRKDPDCGMGMRRRGTWPIPSGRCRCLRPGRDRNAAARRNLSYRCGGAGGAKDHQKSCPEPVS